MNKNIQYIGKSLLIKIDEKNILVIGDLHLGYEASLNAAGVFVTRTLFTSMMEEFHKIFSKVGEIDEIILLGDIKHTFRNILKEEWRDTNSLITFFRENTKKIIVIKGNHDVLTDIIGKRLGFEVVDKHIIGELAFIHGDKDIKEIWDKNIRTVVLGHLHPAVVLSDGIKREKYKCFLVGEYKAKKFIILPSFVAAQEGTDPREFITKLPWNLNLKNFKVIIVGEDLSNYEFGNLKNI